MTLRTAQLICRSWQLSILRDFRFADQAFDLFVESVDCERHVENVGRPQTKQVLPEMDKLLRVCGERLRAGGHEQYGDMPASFEFAVEGKPVLLRHVDVEQYEVDLFFLEDAHGFRDRAGDEHLVPFPAE